MKPACRATPAAEHLGTSRSSRQCSRCIFGHMVEGEGDSERSWLDTPAGQRGQARPKKRGAASPWRPCWPWKRLPTAPPIKKRSKLPKKCARQRGTSSDLTVVAQHGRPGWAMSANGSLWWGTKSKNHVGAAVHGLAAIFTSKTPRAYVVHRFPHMLVRARTAEGSCGPRTAA